MSTRLLPLRQLEDLLKRFRDKIAGWKLKLPSNGEKLLLLLHMLSSMTTYLFSVLSVPKSVLIILNHLLSKFFWGIGMDHLKSIGVLSTRSANQFRKEVLESKILVKYKFLCI